jgi:hypothetical protein
MSRFACGEIDGLEIDARLHQVRHKRDVAGQPVELGPPSIPEAFEASGSWPHAIPCGIELSVARS